MEYTRLVFEERYIQEATPFRCVKGQVERGFGRCICIPGVAINYCMILASYCYDGINSDINQIQWSEEYGVYLPICIFEERKITPNLFGEKETKPFILSDELCAEKVNKIAYIKIRDVQVIKQRYSTLGKNPLKEMLLSDKIEKFSNSMDYLCLFTIIADSYRMTHESQEYVDHLFRLFMFLMPFSSISMIGKNLKNQKDSLQFKKYNKKILDEYLELGKDVKNCDVMAPERISGTINKVTEFTGFNFLQICEKYERIAGEEAVRRLNDLIKKQLDICAKIPKRIQDLLEEIQNE